MGRSFPILVVDGMVHHGANAVRRCDDANPVWYVVVSSDRKHGKLIVSSEFIERYRQVQEHIEIVLGAYLQHPPFKLTIEEAK